MGLVCDQTASGRYKHAKICAVTLKSAGLGMRSVRCGVLFLAIASILIGGHAAAQTADKADLNSAPSASSAEQANSFGPMVLLPENTMEAAQSFRGATFEPDAKPVQNAATGPLTPIVPASMSPETRPVPVFATGKPQPINSFGLCISEGVGCVDPE